ncbi:ABC transporter permease [Flammeovirga yaeyamensis]|uniref:ABC transporter permease n=1 Tax=Flammeovirga yaeyamensis TaxID=367791 RepID=A0AAX1N106_9BACT|nr:ABC transporter permease [Flammeovirga yaeyamensis]MBB3698408.1 putative ABC transport system permease protein [Flammeovirga yaeyamensis]NMF34241.1 FtsX-like permease family protein [Flammeovirga yaeyamensis]QWG01225.1 ABC transporter permease [Flammeovirga yaeyamensis]
MLRNYILIGIRNLQKHGVYSGINIVGMSMGIAFFTLLVLLVNYELSYDSFHKNADQTYRVVEIIDTQDIGERSASVPIALGPTIKTLYPNYIDHSVRFFNHQAYSHVISVAGQKFNENHLYFTDDDFFKVFDFPVVEGDRNSALSEEGSVVITKEIAKKYFGDQSAIGKKILYEKKHYLKVTAVVDKQNYPSHLDFEILVSFSTLNVTNRELFFKEDWVWNPCWTYITLKDGVKPEELEADFEILLQDPSKFPSYLRDYVELYLQPIQEIHLYSDLDFEMSQNGDYMYIYIFSAIAIMVLVIAAINFMNLSSVRYSTRIREVGIRKAIGADQTELINQFVVEAAILSVLSMFGAIVFLELLFSFVNDLLSDSGFILENADPQNIVLLVGSSGLFVGALSSFYPLFYLSGFKPLEGLHDTSPKGYQQKKFRKWSVITQFIISMFLLFSTYVSKRQLDFMKNSDIGFNQENIVIVPMGEVRYQKSNFHLIREKFLQLKDVEAVTAIDELLGVWVQNYPFTFKKGNKKLPSAFYASVVTYPDVFKVFDFKILAKNPTGPLREREIYVNEKLIEFAGYSSPQEALGMKFYTSRGYQKIAGVIKDFHYEPIHKPIEPFVIDVNNGNRATSRFSNKFLALKIRDGVNWNILEKQLNFKWSQVVEYRILDTFFLKSKIEQAFKKEEQLAKVSLIFSIIGVIIANLGLFGLSSFITVRKNKEIAIRKALGMEDTQAMLFVSKEFFVLVITACVVAWPTAYLAMKLWLDNFPKAVNIDIGAYLFSGGLTLLMTMITVSYHVIKTGLKNPVEDLKAGV